MGEKINQKIVDAIEAVKKLPLGTTWTRYMVHFEENKITEHHYTKVDEVFSIDQFGVKRATAFCIGGCKTYKEAKEMFSSLVDEDINALENEINLLKVKKIR